MVSVIIKDSGEPRVVQLTYENLWKELKDIPNAELLVAEDWLEPLSKIKNTYVCFVEADCLVNSGYFSSMLGLFQKNKYFRKLAMLSSSIGVNNWANKFYGYRFNSTWSIPTEDNLQTANPITEPIRKKKSTGVYPLQIGYVPGAIIRKGMLLPALKEMDINSTNGMNLVELSVKLSSAFWCQGDGNRVHINPNTTYVTTEDYVNDVSEFGPVGADLSKMFAKESI